MFYNDFGDNGQCEKIKHLFIVLHGRYSFWFFLYHAGGSVILIVRL